MISIMKALNSSGVREGVGGIMGLDMWKNACGKERHSGCSVRASVHDTFKVSLENCSFHQQSFMSNYFVDSRDGTSSDLTDASLSISTDCSRSFKLGK